MNTHEPANDNFRPGDLLLFVLITFLLSWGLAGLAIFAPELAAGILGDFSAEHPLFILAVWSPAIAAVVVVLWRQGWRGLQGFLRRILLWRLPLRWLLFVLLGVPLINVMGALLLGEALLPELLSQSLGVVLASLLFMAILGPMEEIGWRGLAQPLLQRHLAPLWTGLLIGVIWGIWHLPVFYLPGTVQSEWHFLSFLLGVISLSVIFTALYNDSGGSILWAMLLHFQLNNPLWPDAQPWDSYLLMALAVGLVLVRRRSMLRREGAQVGVVSNSPPDPLHAPRRR